MKRNLLFLLFITQPAAFSHAEPLDSLCEHIGECLDDVTRLEEGRQLLEQAFGRADVEHDRFYPQLLYLQSYYYTNTGDFVRSKQQLLQLLPLLPTDANPELSISVPQDLGLCYRRESQNDSALYYYDLALQAALKQGDMEWQAAINLNIGILHYNLDHLDAAEQYLDRAVSQVRQVDDPYTELCALQVGSVVKWRLKKTDEARSLVEPAYQLALESESPDWQLRCLTTMINVYSHLQLADSAALSLERGNALLPLLPAQSITTIGYLSARSAYYHEHGLWAQSAQDLETVLASGMSGVKTFEGFDHLATCYQHLGQWELAYRYKDSATVYARREADEQFARQLADFNVRYQTMEKDQEISRLHEQRTRIIIIVVAAALLLALLLLSLWLWRRQRRLRREARLRINTLEQERRRIAHELHDGLCNDLLALEMQCTTGMSATDTSTRINALRQQARQLSHQLMPPEFTHLSLSELLSMLADDISKSSSLKAVFSDENGDTDLPPETSKELYRIVQEHTANIVKGATAHHISITLTPRMLTITDDGQPVTEDKEASHKTGIGERTMRDRAMSIGATVNISHEQGQNTLTLQLTL